MIQQCLKALAGGDYGKWYPFRNSQDTGNEDKMLDMEEKKPYRTRDTYIGITQPWNSWLGGDC